MKVSPVEHRLGGTEPRGYMRAGSTDAERLLRLVEMNGLDLS
ncbi:MAG: hypothetical protein OJF51_005109 [Nitrospira sp.]|nr:MAG: hypothetical protein OJF51_005109 [Nitrospira sp.]